MLRLRRVAKGLICVGWLCCLMPAPGRAQASTEASTEFEALLKRERDPSPAYVNPYEHASGGAAVYPKQKPLTWRLRPERRGTYYLWLRARSGYNDDKYYTEKDAATYIVNIGSRQIAMQGQRETLDWYTDGENFIWLRSEPLNLDAGPLSIEVRAKWDWAHLDRMLITSDTSFQPGTGNVAANEQLAGRLDLWTANAYFHPLTPTMTPAEKPSTSLQLSAPGGGSANGLVMAQMQNDAGEPVPFRLFVEPLKGPRGQQLKPTLSLVASTGMVVGASLAMDALPTLNPIGAFELSPGRVRHLWVHVDVPADVEPGTYRGQITFENQVSLKQQGVPIQVDVASTDVSIPGDELVVFSWWGTRHMPDSWWDDQIAHGVNSFLLNVHQDLIYRFDEAGNLLGEIDFTGLNPLLRAWDRSRGSILINWYLHDHNRSMLRCEAPELTKMPGGSNGAALPFMSPAWQKAFTTLLTKTQEHLESHGVPREQVLHYTFDEYLGDRFIEVGKLIRQIDPSLKIFSDLSADLETYKRVSPYVDVWCPVFEDLHAMQADGRLAFIRSTGKPIWAYEPGYTQRAESPYRKFRLKFWIAWQYGLQGCTYWKHQGDRVGTAYYGLSSDDPPVTGRRYEAWFSGWQDYQLLKMLDEVTRESGARAEEAKLLLADAVSQVCSKPEDVTLADVYRAQILAFLDEPG